MLAGRAQLEGTPCYSGKFLDRLQTQRFFSNIARLTMLLSVLAALPPKNAAEEAAPAPKAVASAEAMPAPKVKGILKRIVSCIQVCSFRMHQPSPCMHARAACLPVSMPLSLMP